MFIDWNLDFIRTLNKCRIVNLLGFFNLKWLHVNRDGGTISSSLFTFTCYLFLK